MADTPTGTPQAGGKQFGGENVQGKPKTNKPKNPNKKPAQKPQQTKDAVRLPANMATTLAPPTMKQANDKSTNKPVTNESLVSESVFAVDSGFTARHREISFTPSANGWTNVVDDSYAELRNDSKIQVTKELPIEAYRYYASCMFWLRAISLKLWQGQELTPAEVDVQRVFEGKTFVLPDPIHLGLKAIGRVTTRNGEVLAPTLPPLPDQIVTNIPGLLGAVATANHNVYEDFPVIGVSYQGCYERALRTDYAAYNSVVAPAGTQANRNLQGFDTLKTVRADSLSALHSMGFEVDVRPRTVSNTGFNYNALKVVSNILAKSETFKVVEIDIFAIPATGSLAQIIETIPDQTAVDTITRASSLDVTAQSYAMGTTTQIGISEVFGLNAWKGTSATNPWQSWSCITWTATVRVPDGMVANRNAPRDLPDRFRDRVFYTGSINLEDQRKCVVSRLAKHPS